MIKISRRAFLQSTSAIAVAGTLLGRPASYFAETTAKYLLSERLAAWEFRRGSLGGPWEAWRTANGDANTWTKVEVPHCFNAMDAAPLPNLFFWWALQKRTRAGASPSS
jgi:hypothetical protein